MIKYKLVLKDHLENETYYNGTELSCPRFSKLVPGDVLDPFEYCYYTEQQANEQVNSFINAKMRVIEFNFNEDLSPRNEDETRFLTECYDKLVNWFASMGDYYSSDNCAGAKKRANISMEDNAEHLLWCYRHGYWTGQLL